MSTVERELRLRDSFSTTLGKYIQKMGDAVQGTNRWAREVEEAQNALADLGAQIDAADKAGASTKALRTEYGQWIDILDQVQDQYDRRADRTDRFAGAVDRTRSSIGKLTNSIFGLGKTSSPIDGITKKFRAMALSLFTARRLLSYIRNAAKRAPEEIASPWNKLQQTISDTFAGGIVSMMKGMGDGLRSVNSAMDSSSGQRLARGIEAVNNAIGQLIGFGLNALAAAVTWLGDNIDKVMLAASLAVAFLTLKFSIMGAAAIAAHWPILLMAAGVITLIETLDRFGVTSEQVLAFVGKGFGWLYALGYNYVADGWNVVAGFVEFFQNVWDDPLRSVARLFFNTFDGILGVVETTAKAIDALLGSNMSNAVAGWRSSLQGWVEDSFGTGKVTVARMEKIGFQDSMDKFGSWAGNIGKGLTSINLDKMNAQSLKNISADTKSIKNSVAKEDLKAIIETATRAFVAQVNLTSQTPVITINGANTGNTEADRRALANVIKTILIEQVAAGSTSSPYVYSM